MLAAQTAATELNSSASDTALTERGAYDDLVVTHTASKLAYDTAKSQYDIDVETVGICLAEKNAMPTDEQEAFECDESPSADTLNE